MQHFKICTMVSAFMMVFLASVNEAFCQMVASNQERTYELYVCKSSRCELPSSLQITEVRNLQNRGW